MRVGATDTMADLALHTDGVTAVTCVSNIFIDHYMAEANGEYVKIYLYLLRCLNTGTNDFSISAIAAHLGHTDLDVKRALQYWEARHLLRLEYDWNQQLCGICLMDPYTHGFSQATPVTNAPLQATPSTSVVKAPAPVMAIPDYTPEQISNFEQDEDVKDLLFLTEFHTKKQLSPMEMNTVLFWYDKLHLPASVIEFLINYCVSEGHTHIAYMNKVAISWAKAGIKSLPEAEAALLSHSETYHAIISAFGISGRGLSTVELEYLNRWTKEYGFSKEIITEACNRAILRNTANPFKYADKILAGWKEQNVSSKADIETLDASFASRQTAGLASKNVTWQASLPASAPRRDKFTNYGQDENFDWDAYEQKLLLKK